MKHNMVSHVLWMIGGFLALILIGKLFNLNLIFLYPLICIGMMVWMMFAMGRHDNMNHK